ncbi:HEAT repeat-containing protein 6 isoform X4 [Canna indica]|uniref:HEAT repeat-containing protein 6 isoform X4 n=1 Tax=Canna indica TaxID=4628 RepID=A0AAQ3JS50_9LILI|nr:HEAT repeat-containing protein 6 isoform X4 [Canna indica]
MVLVWLTVFFLLVFLLVLIIYQVRPASLTCFAGMTSAVFSSLTKDKQDFVISSAVTAALTDGVPSVRSAACRAIGVLTCFSEIVSRSMVINEFIRAADYNSHDSLALVHSYIPSPSILIKSNAMRALGNLSRFIRLSQYEAENLPSASKSDFYGNPYWLERMLQAFVSCVTTGNVKVQWNVCHALSNLFMNGTIKLHQMSWAPTVYSILLLLLRDSTNFKIRIHAAVALAVPTSRTDYGSSFSDVVQSIEHVRESLVSDHSSTPLTFQFQV